MGDATKTDVLEHAGIHEAVVVVVTVPDSRSAAGTIRTIRALSPNVKIIARGRYHRHLSLLEAAGASLVVDEEQMVGARLAEATVGQLSETDHTAMACRIVGKNLHIQPTDRCRIGAHRQPGQSRADRLKKGPGCRVTDLKRAESTGRPKRRPGFPAGSAAV